MSDDFEVKKDEYWEWFYSSKMRIKRRVLSMERQTAKDLAMLLKHSKPLNNVRFSSDIEWLLTWKFKTGCCPEFMWCDGIEFQSIRTTSKYTINFEGLAWVGPESSDELLNVPFIAQMTLKPNGKQFKSYWFKINYKDQCFLPKKELNQAFNRTRLRLARLTRR